MKGSERLRVAILTSFPRDAGAPVGGVESVSVNLVRALAKLKDLEIHVITTGRDCETETGESWEGTTIRRLPWAGGTTLVHATGPGRRQMRECLMRLKPDVIHAHDTYGLMVKGISIPRVLTIHGFIHRDTLLSGQKLARVRSWIWRHVETRGWADQPHIISISPYVRERLADIAEGGIHDIDNPITESFLDIKRVELKGNIFCCALICRLKNTLTLIDAVARLVSRGLDVKLRLAGSIRNADYGRQVEERIRKLKLETCVNLLGRINAEQVRSELAAASVFALVSLEENSPMGIEEAMAAGVPVVTSNRCGMPYMVRDGESGYLVDPNDPEDIAWRLEQLLGDENLRTAMGAKSREIAKDRFHPAAVARRTRDVYLRAIRDHNHRGGRES